MKALPRLCMRPLTVAGTAVVVVALVVGCTSSATRLPGTSPTVATASAPLPAPSTASTGAPSTASAGAASSAGSAPPVVTPSDAPSTPATPPPTLARASAGVVAARVGQAVQVTVGELVQVELPASQGGADQQTSFVVMPVGSAVIAPVSGSAGRFVAERAGLVKVGVTQRPVCVAGQACVAHIVLIGSVTITVTG